jgi:hypothetical protein
MSRAHRYRSTLKHRGSTINDRGRRLLSSWPSHNYRRVEDPIAGLPWPLMAPGILIREAINLSKPSEPTRLRASEARVETEENRRNLGPLPVTRVIYQRLSRTASRSRHSRPANGFTLPLPKGGSMPLGGQWGKRERAR